MLVVAMAAFLIHAELKHESSVYSEVLEVWYCRKSAPNERHRQIRSY